MVRFIHLFILSLFCRCTHRREVTCNKGAARISSELPVTRLGSLPVVRHSFTLSLRFQIWQVHQLMTQIVPPLSEDESSSKEEPSSTVEEIETKAFTEQSSEEIQREPDEGTKIHFYNPQICFFCFSPHFILL